MNDLLRVRAASWRGGGEGKKGKKSFPIVCLSSVLVSVKNRIGKKCSLLCLSLSFFFHVRSLDSWHIVDIIKKREDIILPKIIDTSTTIFSWHSHLPFLSFFPIFKEQGHILHHTWHYKSSILLYKWKTVISIFSWLLYVSLCYTAALLFKYIWK